MADFAISARCPACRSNSFELTETLEENEIREVRDGILLEERVDHEAGGHIGWFARCACGHSWVPRASSIEPKE